MWKRRKTVSRCGAVAVEFAFVAPFLLSIALGLIELTRSYDAQNLLETAAREGARLASMDRTGLVAEGQSANSKLIGDVKNFLTSAGLPAEGIEVKVVSYDSPDTPFNLDDPANDLQLFNVEVRVPYSSVSYTPVSDSNDYSMSASITFRNGRAVLTQ